MGIPSQKIALLFWENAPCNQAGKCIEFEATPEKCVWRAGRDPRQCDSQLHIKNALISRIHFTLYFRKSDEKWLLIDGGVYKDGDEVEQFVRPSSNGVRIKRKQKWERISGQTEIEVGTLIWLGPDFRMAVVEDCSDTTIGQFYWIDSNWPIIDRENKQKNEKPVEPAVEKELVRHADVTIWAIILDVVNWLQEKPATRTDLIYKLVVILCMLQALLIAAATFIIWKVYPLYIEEQNDSRSRAERTSLFENNRIL